MKNIFVFVLALLGASPSFAQTTLATRAQIRYLLGTTTQSNQVLQTDGSGNVVQSTSLPSAGITGVTSGVAACAGCVGQLMELNGAAVDVNSAAIIPVATMTLTPGDWLVSGVVAFQTGVTSNITALTSSLSLSNSSYDTVAKGNIQQFTTNINSQTQNWISSGTRRVNVSVSTPIYLLGQYSGTAFGTNNTILSSSYISANRVR